MIDTHCHIQFKGFADNRAEVIKRCHEKQVVLNIVGTQKETSKAAVALAEKNDNMYASIGIHPIHLFPTHVDEEESGFRSREEDFAEKYYEELLKSGKVIGIGETGLDFYHLPKDISREKVLQKQKQVFLAQIAFARKYDLPLVIHCREAHPEMIEILQSLNRKISGTMHCFAGNWTQAQKYLELGLYLGFTGVVTFPPKKTNPQMQTELLEVVKKMPLDRILVETDSPYLAPQAYRGQRAEPWMAEEIIKKIAEIRQENIEKMSNIVFQNALNLFTKIKQKSVDISLKL